MWNSSQNIHQDMSHFSWFSYRPWELYPIACAMLLIFLIRGVMCLPLLPVGWILDDACLKWVLCFLLTSSVLVCGLVESPTDHVIFACSMLSSNWNSFVPVIDRLTVAFSPYILHWYFLAKKLRFLLLGKAADSRSRQNMNINHPWHIIRINKWRAYHSANSPTKDSLVLTRDLHPIFLLPPRIFIHSGRI